MGVGGRRRGLKTSVEILIRRKEGVLSRKAKAHPNEIIIGRKVWGTCYYSVDAVITLPIADMTSGRLVGAACRGGLSGFSTRVARVVVLSGF